ncbi:unnamed protein product [Heterobilharzia americana]|nr:unnamed protein product [Heterobilharzia americana]
MADKTQRYKSSSNTGNKKTEVNKSSETNTLDGSKRSQEVSGDRGYNVTAEMMVSIGGSDVDVNNDIGDIEEGNKDDDQAELEVDDEEDEEMDDDDDDDSDSSSSGSSVARLVQTARNLVQVEKAEQIAQEENESLNLKDCQLTDEEEHQPTVLIQSDTDSDKSPGVVNQNVSSSSLTNDPNSAVKPTSSSPTTVISAKAAATLGIDLSDKSVGLLTIPYHIDTNPRYKSKPKDYFRKKIDKEFIGQLQRAHKRDGTPRESIHESLERLPTLESEAKKSTSSSSAQHFRQEKSDGLSRNSFAPADFTSTSPRHSTVTGGVGGKKNKLGFQFFRPKPVVQSGAKLVQVKELKRMIRAGNQALLNDKYGLALFKDFLSTEFSDENIEFWIACQDYKHTTNPKKLVAKASQIYAEFIAVQANREVNLDSKTRLQTEADLQILQ